MMKYFINPNGSIPIKAEFISLPKWECLLSGVPFCGWDAQIRKAVIDILAKRNWNEVKQRWTAIKDPKTHWFRVVTAIAKMKLPNNYIYPDDNVEVLSIASGWDNDIFPLCKEEVLWRGKRNADPYDLFVDYPENFSAITVKELIEFYSNHNKCIL